MNAKKMKTTLKLVTTLLLLICFVAIFYEESLAAIQSGGVLNEVYTKYKEASSAWVSVIQNAATRLFWALTAISMVWTFSQLLFHRSSLAELFGELIRFMLFTGFYLWLLTNGPTIAEDIIISMRELAMSASEQGSISPSSIVDIGFSILSDACEKISAWSLLSPITSAGCLITSGIILVVLALVAINMLLQLCSAWVLAYAGIFFLGFGGSKWTSDMAINYFKTVLGLGASLMTMVLLVGIGTNIIEGYHLKMSEDMKLQELAVLLVASITLLLLVDKLPAMVAGIITGASIGSSGGGSFGAGAAVGAAMTAGSMAASAGGLAKGAAGMAGRTALAGAANIVGLAKAFKNAKSNLSTDGGGSGGGLSAAMGNRSPSAVEVGKAMAGAAASMAGQAMGNAVNNAKQGFSNQVQNSMGGKLAESFKNGGDKGGNNES